MKKYLTLLCLGFLSLLYVSAQNQLIKGPTAKPKTATNTTTKGKTQKRTTPVNPAPRQNQSKPTSSAPKKTTPPAPKAPASTGPKTPKQIYELGLSFENKDNWEEAAAYYQQAADQNYAPAQYALGNSYQNGWGVAVNKNEARNWYEKAAEQGDEYAKKALQNL